MQLINHSVHLSSSSLYDFLYLLWKTFFVHAGVDTQGVGQKIWLWQWSIYSLHFSRVTTVFSNALHISVSTCATLALDSTWKSCDSSSTLVQSRIALQEDRIRQTWQMANVRVGLVIPWVWWSVDQEVK